MKRNELSKVVEKYRNQRRRFYVDMGRIGIEKKFDVAPKRNKILEKREGLTYLGKSPRGNCIYVFNEKNNS